MSDRKDQESTKNRLLENGISDESDSEAYGGECDESDGWFKFQVYKEI